MKLVVLSILAFMLTACGDNIRPAGTGTDEECFDENCPTDIDQPDGGAPIPDGDTGGGDDGGAGPGTDAGSGSGTDGGTDAGDPEGIICAPDEVRLCHAPPGNADGAHVICVGAGAADAHRAHGDALGDCP